MLSPTDNVLRQSETDKTSVHEPEILMEDTPLYQVLQRDGIQGTKDLNDVKSFNNQARADEPRVETTATSPSDTGMSDRILKWMIEMEKIGINVGIYPKVGTLAAGPYRIMFCLDDGTIDPYVDIMDMDGFTDEETDDPLGWVLSQYRDKPPEHIQRMFKHSEWCDGE